MEKGCFWGGAANIAFCEEDRMTSPGVLNTAPNMPARNPPCQQTANVSIRQHKSGVLNTAPNMACTEAALPHL
jgi:hypothetical protein